MSRGCEKQGNKLPGQQIKKQQITAIPSLCFICSTTQLSFILKCSVPEAALKLHLNLGAERLLSLSVQKNNFGKVATAFIGSFSVVITNVVTQYTMYFTLFIL